jgi:hypothetical protein
MADRRRHLGAGRAGPLPQPTWPAWLPAWRPGPPSQRPWVKLTLVQKVPANLFYFQEIQKNTTTCKMHIYLFVGQKNVYDLSNCLEKHALNFYIKIMHA